MKSLLRQRWPWFVLGMICIPTVSLVRDLFAPANAKDAMPYQFVREEFTRTFRGDNDYNYTLRSRGSKVEFLQFVRKMKMEDRRVNDDRYEKKEMDGRLVTTITYADDWITYEEFFT